MLVINTYVLPKREVVYKAPKKDLGPVPLGGETGPLPNEYPTWRSRHV